MQYKRLTQVTFFTILSLLYVNNLLFSMELSSMKKNKPKYIKISDDWNSDKLTNNAILCSISSEDDFNSFRQQENKSRYFVGKNKKDEERISEIKYKTKKEFNEELNKLFNINTIAKKMRRHVNNNSAWYFTDLNTQAIIKKTIKRGIAKQLNFSHKKKDITLNPEGIFILLEDNKVNLSYVSYYRKKENIYAFIDQ